MWKTNSSLSRHAVTLTRCLCQQLAHVCICALLKAQPSIRYYQHEATFTGTRRVAPTSVMLEIHKMRSQLS
jgi:hypothetical protein